MGCNSSHMEPTPTEKHIQLTAKLFVHLYTHLGLAIPDVVSKAAKDIYASNRDIEPALCSALKAFQVNTPTEFEAFIYDGRDPVRRQLTEWWQQHEVFDQEREQANAEIEVRASTATKALLKLTRLEAAALGLQAQWDEARRNTKG